MWNIPASTTNATCRSWNGSRDPHEVRLKRREINWHYDRKAEAWRDAPSRRTVQYLYGGLNYGLPDDDAGRDNAFVMTCHLAHCPEAPHWIRDNWLKRHCPWMTPAERQAMMARPMLHFRADTLARRLGVTYAMRQGLGLWSIGACNMTPDEREVPAQARRPGPQGAETAGGRGQATGRLRGGERQPDQAMGGGRHLAIDLLPAAR